MQHVTLVPRNVRKHDSKLAIFDMLAHIWNKNWKLNVPKNKTGVKSRHTWGKEAPDFDRWTAASAKAKRRLQLVDDHRPIQGQQHGIQEAKLHEDGAPEDGRQLADWLAMSGVVLQRSADKKFMRQALQLRNLEPPALVFYMLSCGHRCASAAASSCTWHFFHIRGTWARRCSRGTIVPACFPCWARPANGNVSLFLDDKFDANIHEQLSSGPRERLGIGN